MVDIVADTSDVLVADTETSDQAEEGGHDHGGEKCLGRHVVCVLIVWRDDGIYAKWWLFKGSSKSMFRDFCKTVTVHR